MCVPTGSPPWRLQVIRHRRSCGCDVRRINRDCRRLKNKRGGVLLRVWRHHLLKRQRATRAFLKAAPTPRGRPVARRGGTLPPSPPFSCPPTKLTEVALGSPRPPSPSPGRRGMGWAGWLGRSERARGRGGRMKRPFAECIAAIGASLFAFLLFLFQLIGAALLLVPSFGQMCLWLGPSVP
ncbi:hypothetical protein TcG_09224 [Trypanosoma cruzi]|nr:hypothetical protein TcG_09224 [Trypanosoma cruzi]